MKATQAMLKADAGIGAIGDVRVTRGERINTDPALTPWVGIYIIGEDYVSRTLGVAAGFRMQHMGIAVVLQQSSRTSGEKCQDLLEQLKQAVIASLLSDPSLGGTVDTLADFAVIYASAEKQGSGDINFQTAIISVKAMGPTQVTDV